MQAASSAGLGGTAGGSAPAEGALVAWCRRRAGGGAGGQQQQEEEGGVQGSGVLITHKFPVRWVSWHARGDYLSSVAPTGNTQAVLVHQLSRGASQNPFRKNRGRVPAVLFHPSKPFFFVAAQNHVYVYNLAKQVRVARCGAGWAGGAAYGGCTLQPGPSV